MHTSIIWKVSFLTTCNAALKPRNDPW